MKQQKRYALSATELKSLGDGLMVQAEKNNKDGAPGDKLKWRRLAKEKGIEVSNTLAFRLLTVDISADFHCSF